MKLQSGGANSLSESTGFCSTPAVLPGRGCHNCDIQARLFLQPGHVHGLGDHIAGQADHPHDVCVAQNGLAFDIWVLHALESRQKVFVGEALTHWSGFLFIELVNDPSGLCRHCHV